MTVAHVALLAPMRSELRPLVRALALRRSASSPRTYAGRAGRLTVTAMQTGVGTDAATRATRRLLDARADAGPIDHVIIAGIAGGIDDRLAIGDLVVPRAVIDARTGETYTPHPFGDPPEAASPASPDSPDGPGFPDRLRGSRVSDGLVHTSDEPVLDRSAVAALAARGVVALDMETAAVAAVCEERGCPWSVFRAISDRSADGLVDEAIAGLARSDGSSDLRAVARLVARHPTRLRGLARLGRDAHVAARAAAVAASTAVRRAATSLDGAP